MVHGIKTTKMATKEKAADNSRKQVFLVKTGMLLVLMFCYSF